MLNLTQEEDSIFFTIQGEGKYIGYPCVFVRLSKCNLRCTWKNPDGTLTKCDTPHTSFTPEVVQTHIQYILDSVDKYDTEHVVVSGGEPFFQKSVVQLINKLVDMDKFVTVETNGTLYHDNKAQFISISPKLKSSSMSPEYGRTHNKNRIKFDKLITIIKNHKYQFKFVVNTEEDILEIKEISDIIYSMSGIRINDHIWLMPQGITQKQFDEKMVFLVDVCKSNNWKLTDRLHIRIFGNKKGV